MSAIVPVLLLAFAAIAPVAAFATIALAALKGSTPAERPKILRELAAMIAWRSGQPSTGRQQRPIKRRTDR